MREVSIRFRDIKSITKLRNLANKYDIPMTKFVMKAIENFGKENTNNIKCKILEGKIVELQRSNNKYKNLYESILNQSKSTKTDSEVNSLIAQLSKLCNGSFKIIINEHKDEYSAHTLEYSSPYSFYLGAIDDCSHSYLYTPIDIDIIDNMGINDTSLKLEGYYNGKFFRVLHYNIYDLLANAINLINEKQNINQ